MSRTRLSDVVRSWVRRVRKPAKSSRRPSRPISFLEYEQRIAPAVIPGSAVFETRFITAYGPYDATLPPDTPYQVFDAVSAVDPNNPRKIVQISVEVLQNNNGLPSPYNEYLT